MIPLDWPTAWGLAFLALTIGVVVGFFLGEHFAERAQKRESEPRRPILPG